MEKKNIDKFYEKFNRLLDLFNKNISEEDKQWMDHWQTYLALAIIDDLNYSTANEIADIISTICSCER